MHLQQPVKLQQRDEWFTHVPDLSCSWALIFGGEYNTKAFSSSGSCNGCKEPVLRTPNARLPSVGPAPDMHIAPYVSSQHSCYKNSLSLARKVLTDNLGHIIHTVQSFHIHTVYILEMKWNESAMIISAFKNRLTASLV